MNRHAPIGFLTAALTPCLMAAAAPPTAPHRWYVELEAPDLDEERIGAVRDVTLARESARFHLSTGTVHFFQPCEIEGVPRVTGCIFVGKGTFSYTPPVDVEKKQMHLFFETESMTMDFETLYLRFSDNTAEQLMEHIEWTGKKVGRPESQIEYCAKFFTPSYVCNLLCSVLRDDDGPSFFYAHFSEKSRPRKPHFFRIDPMREEEVAFLQRQPVDTAYRKELVNSHHLAEEYTSGGDLAGDSKAVIQPVHYVIESDIGGSGAFDATTTMTFEVLQERLRVVPLWITSRINVETVESLHDPAISIERPHDSAHLFLFFEEPLAAGDTVSIRLAYDGDVLGRSWNGYYVKNSIGWYPTAGPSGSYGYRHRATFDLTFKFDSRYELLSVGTKIEETERHPRKQHEMTSRWRVDEPTKYVSFNLGKFESYRQPAMVDTLPTVTCYMTKEGRVAMKKYFHQLGIGVQKDMEERVAVDVANACNFYSWLFGRCASDSIAATEIPLGHGQSFPGLLHLSWATFVSDDPELQLKPIPGAEKAFRAHEVAHQWWGNAVSPETYHDAWLSEGFAEYSGYWFVQWALKNNDAFLGLLGNARVEVLRFHEKTRGRGGRPQAPIWMGGRTNTSNTEGDYSRLVYHKGAWIMHMLRYLLLDLDSVSEDVFTNLMRDYYRRYRGRNASTEDFRRLVEEHVGMSMDWFFDQWVYGTDIPTYQFGSGWRQDATGTWRVQCQVRQQNVPEDFQMYVICRIEFAGEQHYRFRVLVDQPVVNFTVPVPLEPKGVVFNDLASVLAVVEDI